MTTIRDYQDEYGLIHSKAGERCNNPLRYSAEASIFGLIRPVELVRAVIWLRGPRVLLIKAPNNTTDQITIDDFLPLVHAYRRIDSPLYSAFCDQLFWSLGWYRNTYQKIHGFKPWLGRHFACWPALAPGVTWWWQKLILYSMLPVSWITIGVTGMTDPKTQDGYCLAWHLTQLLPKNRITRYCYGLMRRRMLKAYPGGFKELLTTYFQHEHPLALAWREDL